MNAILQKMRAKKITKRTLFEYGMIMAGTAIMAAGITLFYEPNELITGGVSGLGIVINAYSEYLGHPIPIWLSNLALNIPLFLLGFKAMSRKFLIRTGFATVFFSFSLFFTQFIPPLMLTDLVLVSIFGAVFAGAGMALVLLGHATTGGTDMAAGIINSKFKHIDITRLLFFLDGGIIVVGLLQFGLTKALYAIIAVYLTSKVIDAVFAGLSFAKAVFIISENSDEISDAIMREMDRGVTGLRGKGMYTRTDKNVLLCVVSSKEIVKLKDIVTDIDPKSFVIVADVREVMGEGFRAGLNMNG